jgi:hypothetical protein
MPIVRDKKSGLELQRDPFVSKDLERNTQELASQLAQTGAEPGKGTQSTGLPQESASASQPEALQGSLTASLALDGPPPKRIEASEKDPGPE